MDDTECLCDIGNESYPDEGKTNKYGANAYNFAQKKIVNFKRNYKRLLDIVLNHL